MVGSKLRGRRTSRSVHPREATSSEGFDCSFKVSGFRGGAGNGVGGWVFWGLGFKS